MAQDNGAVEWQWSKKAGTIAFRNPKRDVWFYLHVDGKPAFLPQPQQVTVRIGEQVVDQFTLSNPEAMIRKTAIGAAQLGTADTVELVIDAGTSFVPAQTPAAKSGDPRELGVRVFHAFIEPKSRVRATTASGARASVLSRDCSPDPSSPCSRSWRLSLLTAAPASADLVFLATRAIAFGARRPLRGRRGGADAALGR